MFNFGTLQWTSFSTTVLRPFLYISHVLWYSLPGHQNRPWDMMKEKGDCELNEEEEGGDSKLVD